MAKKAKTRRDDRKGGQRSLADRRRRAGPRSGGSGRRPAAAKKRLPGRAGVVASGADLAHFFPRLLSVGCREGEGVLLARAKRAERRFRLSAVCFDGRAGGNGRRPASEAALWKDSAALARLLHGLAHPQRLDILGVMRRGARRHQDLKAAVGLAAGPLYHHLRELERSGLVACPMRNDYTLTDLGHLSLLLAAGLEALSGDAGPARPWRSKRYQTRIASQQDTKQSKPR